MQSIVVRREGSVEFRMCLKEDAGDPITTSLRSGKYDLLNDPITLQKWVAEDVSLVDVGANIGCFSLVFATQGHPVLALEASPTNAHLLSQGAAANSLANVNVQNVAVSDRKGQLEFCEAGPFGYVASDGAPRQARTTEVAAVTLDGWSPAEQLSDRVVIKMDIEGHEIRALTGMRVFLRQRNLPPLFIESNGHCLNWFGATPVTLCRLLHQLGYTVYRFEGEGLRVWGPQEPQIRVVENLLCVRPPDDRIQLPPIGERRPPRMLVAEIARAARHPNPAQRAHLGRVLAEFPQLAKSPHVLPLVKPLLDDSEAMVRQAMRWAA